MPTSKKPAPKPNPSPPPAKPAKVSPGKAPRTVSAHPAKTPAAKPHSPPPEKKNAKPARTEAAPGKAATPAGRAPAVPADDQTKSVSLKALSHRPKHTPAIFKLPVKKQTPIVFTLEDVREVLKTRQEERRDPPTDLATAPEVPDAVPSPAAAAATAAAAEAQRRVVQAASLADILGLSAVTQITDPAAGREVPRKWQRYYHLLLELRNHLREEVDLHTKENLSRSAKEDSGDLSSYSQHMADAGTDTFDRDFAMSLVSNEKEALAEIEAAIERIFNGSYGVCEITGKPIPKERLEAVPFTRFSLEGQAEYEKTHRRNFHRHHLLTDYATEEAGGFAEEASDE